MIAIKKNILLTMCFFIFSCNKEEILKPTLAEQIIGKWELRARIGGIYHQDLEWHDLETPYSSFTFKMDNSFEARDKSGFVFSKTIYSVSEPDSIINIEGVLIFKPQAFTGKSFEICLNGIEGLEKRRYIKVE